MHPFHKRVRAPRPLPKNTALTKEELVEHYHSHLEFNKTKIEAFADFLTQRFGTVWFLIINALFFLIWITWNSGVLGFTPFDPAPFILLTMMVSLEAIFLAIIVLISQNRQSKIAEIRQKLDFEIDVRSEEEVTKMLVMLEELHRHLGLRHHKDSELEWMKRKIDLGALKRSAEE